jgi:hypothetical protein
MVPTGSAFLSIFPVSGPAFTPSGPPIVMSWQSAPLTVLFVAMDIVVIVSVPLRAFSVNGFQANPHVLVSQPLPTQTGNTGSRRDARSAEKDNISFLAVSGGGCIPTSLRNPHVVEMQPFAS